MDHDHSKHSPGKPTSTSDGEQNCCSQHQAVGTPAARGQHGGHEHHHHTHDADVKAPEGSKYYCPMCEGVESEQPGDCPKCGMALERNPAFYEAARILYTCPMHPQIEQDHPGSCPICGMALEPKSVSASESPEENSELRDMTRRLWIGGILALPVFVLGMLHLVPSVMHVANAPLSR